MMTVSLGSVAEVDRDGVNPNQLSKASSYVGLEHIGNDGSLVNAPTVDPGDLASTKFRFSSRHILFGKLRPYLRKVARPFFDGICSTDIIPILPSSYVNRDYLFHFLRTDAVIDRATTLSVGINLPRLNPRDLLKFEIPLPPLDEQRRIAEILDQADELRRKRRHALDKCDELLTSVFIDFFGNPVSNERGWALLPIGNLKLKIADGNYAEKYPTSTDFVDQGVPFIRAENLRDMTIDGSKMRFISAGKHAELRKGHLQEDDVLITTRGQIGDVALVSAFYAGSNVNAQIVILRSQDVDLTPLYLAHVLHVYRMRDVLESYQTGVALKQLPIRSLKTIPIPVPPRSDQHRYARAAEGISAVKHRMQNSLSRLDRLFTSLQHHAFAGTLASTAAQETLASFERANSATALTV